MFTFLTIDSDFANCSNTSLYGGGGKHALVLLARVSSLDFFLSRGEVMVCDFIIARIQPYKPIIQCLIDINLKALASDKGNRPILPRMEVSQSPRLRHHQSGIIKRTV